MFIDVQEMRALGANQLEAATAATAKGLHAISTEATEFSQKRVERSFAFAENLLHAQKFDEIVQLQSDFAMATYDDFIAQAARIGSIFLNLAKEAFVPGRVIWSGKSAMVAPPSSAPVAATQSSAQKK